MGREPGGASSLEIAGTGDRYERIHAWVVAHDDSRLFLALYIGLALVLSIAIGLFWLVALVAVHLGFEYVRCRHEGYPGARAIGAAAWGVRLDIALVLFALVLAVYLHVVFGVLGLNALGRAGMAVQAGMRGGVRFATWEKVIRGVLLSIDDAVQGARALTAFRPAQVEGGALAVAAPAVAAAPARRWTTGEILTLLLGGASILLLLASPLLTQQSWSEVVALLSAELRPFPSR